MQIEDILFFFKMRIEAASIAGDFEYAYFLNDTLTDLLEYSTRCYYSDSIGTETLQ